MTFQKYQHVEKFGTTETEGIDLGSCHIFPKLDGTNGSIWFEDGEIKAGSRNRVLSLEEDNAGFLAWVKQQESFVKFFREFPNVTLYGEWLVPHSLKTYRADAWRKFYVFDVVAGETYVEFCSYRRWLDTYCIDYVPAICEITNPTRDQLIHCLSKNTFLIRDGEGVGEGIVIKNYGYKNKFGRQTWAKIVTNEFKEKHAREMGTSTIKGTKTVEEDIAEKYVTQTLVEKEYAKLVTLNDGWSSKLIPRLLETVYYCLITEEAWNFLKEFKNPTVDFKKLRGFTTHFIKAHKPELF